MNDAKEEIRDRLNIEDVVGEYVELKRAGRNFKALSPFSNEKTPSFIVSPDKRIWHDFSSGKGGDVFSFVMEMEGVDFKEALKILARKAGVELKLFSSANSQKLAKRKAREQEMYTLVTKYYQAILAKNPHALEYAKTKRRLTDATLKAFAIGYAPNHKRALLDFLLKRGYKLPEIAEAGLLNQYKTDLFRARLMIPLSDAMGQTIGFTGRGLEADAVPKYLNTPATLLYDKSRHVFGLFQAKEAIRKLNQVVIVEGNMDVISSHQAGVKQVVATAGTAMTEQHLKILARYTSDIRLAFDADNAGINATERAIVLAQTANVDIKIISLIGEAKDPDELIQQDVALWQEAIDQAEPAVDWLMRVYQTKFDLSQSAAKRDYSRKILTTITQLTDPVEKESYLQKLADIVEISLEAIKSQLEDLNKPEPKKPLKSKKPSLDSTTDEFKYQDDLLAMCLVSKEARRALASLDARAIVDFKDKPRQQLASLLIKAGDDFSKDQLGGLQGLTIYGKVLTLKTEERYLLWSKTEVEREARRLIEQSRADFQKNVTEQLTDQLRQAEYDGDEARAMAIRAELNQLIKGDKK